MPAAISLLPLPCEDAADLPENTPSADPQIDAAAMALLQTSAEAMLVLTSYRAECETTFFALPAIAPAKKPLLIAREKAALTCEKPNRMRYDNWMTSIDAQGQWEVPRDAPRFTFVCDGQALWQQFGKTFRKSIRVDPVLLHTISEPWNGFFSILSSPYQRAAGFQSHPQIGQLLEARRDGSETIEGVLCEKVFVYTRMHYEGKMQEYRMTWYIGSDGLMRRQVQQVRIEGASGFIRDAVVRGIETNAPIASPETVFAYVAPEGVVLREKQEIT